MIGPAMSPEDFDAAIDRTRLKATARRVAYQVLVVGWSRAEAAELAGVSRQAASAAVLRVLRAREELLGHTGDLIPITITIPPALADSFRSLAVAGRVFEERIRELATALEELRELEGLEEPEGDRP